MFVIIDRKKLQCNIYIEEYRFVFDLLQTVFPMNALFSIDHRRLSIKESQHVSVFLHKLCNSRTGFTALGIFTIDKATILSVSSALLFRRKIPGSGRL